VNASPEALLEQALPLQRNDKYGDAEVVSRAVIEK
tara:strand:- start:1225 stop:1329 length:105 start_codon:yes stop_codon:yes gene_type:complete